MRHRYLPLLLLCLMVHSTMASDYTREKRWADQTVPDIFVGDAVYLEAEKHKFLTLYTEADNAKTAVILAHGLGVHPNWRLIGTMRTELADQGFTTLSLQMPILASDAKVEEYRPTFPEAAARIEAAIAFLKSKGYKSIVLVSHSMGTRMSDYYFSQHPNTEIKTWVAIGLPVNYQGLEKARPRVLDLYGENDFDSVRATAADRAATIKKLPGSKQIMAPGMDHFFTDKESVLVKYVADFLRNTQ